MEQNVAVPTSQIMAVKRNVKSDLTMVLKQLLNIHFGADSIPL